ncbi:hypothetical protein WJX81_005013 [Elliptochloris bilobata]|uniref:Nucleotide-diphospho-sugar transferase domain-containing protein n=1 Tax=Elliptochloris bilobata TaxID=381761 RepID=A0AAW1QLB0_9CHLO
MDTARPGRNAWANYYQFRAQQAFLRRLERAGQSRDVVFLDMDALVVAPLAPAFAAAGDAEGPSFDLALTLSDATDMPINMGVQLVPRGRYQQAMAVLDAVCEVYPFNESFIAGQLALASYLGVLNNETALLRHLDAAISGGRSCLAVPVRGSGGSSTGTVCLLPCLRWNYCHDDQSCCTSPARLPLGLTSRAQLERAGTAVLHQVGPRKKALDLLAASFISGGRSAAYDLFVGLPHNETGFAAFDLDRAVRNKFGKGEAELIGMASAASPLATHFADHKWKSAKESVLSMATAVRRAMMRTSWPGWAAIPYANYYQFRAQQAYLRHLQQLGVHADVVFLDMDALVVAPMAPLFAPVGAASTFDFAVTLSDAVDMPINMGVQMVSRGRYQQAVAVLEAVCERYPFNESFIAGQVALGTYLGVHGREGALLGHLEAVLERAGVVVLHQVGPRKKALDLLAVAFLAGGRSAAYDVFSRLPHNEQGFAGFDAAGAAAAIGLSPVW